MSWLESRMGGAPGRQLRMMGDLVKSPSAKPRAEATIKRDVRRCHHPQAEPVILSTGEQVACVCIGCYEPLPADYIERQAETAYCQAYCTHDRGIEVTRPGQLGRTYTCPDCGSWMSDDTWPEVHLA